MGTQDVRAGLDGAEMRAFMKHLLTDFRALETMVSRGDLALDKRRIGAEQELFLVDDAWRPACISEKMVDDIDDDRFTTELARFNLEFNLDPLEFGGNCLSTLEGQIQVMLERCRESARKFGADVLMTGILPTLQKSDLDLENMTNRPRYAALNDAMTRLRGGTYEFRIQGVDEISFKHYSVMLEACNTSFQVHFQVGADEFAKLYNLAQAVTGPVLAAAANSPVLLQRRLWHETRVALFAQSLDVRSDTLRERGKRQRVTFGTSWCKDGVVDIFKRDVSRFRALLATELGESSMDMLDRGETPPLRALCLHNGTVYRWNRPCYGVVDGVPHLRIENRVLPAGPTVPDMMAGAAFYFGLMVALGEEYGDVTKVIDFEDAKHNFLHAARYGLGAQFRWIHGESQTARDLILQHLLPLAEQGMRSKGLASEDIDRYVGMMTERIERSRNGAQWALDSLNSMGDAGTADGRHRALTQAAYRNQLEGAPVHKWPLATYDPGRADLLVGMRKVSQVMTTDVFSVHPEDVLELAASLMDWEHLRRVPVEDDQGRLVGLLTQRGLLRLLVRGKGADPVAVSEVMRRDPITCTPETTTLEAMRLMREHRVGSLPVVEEGNRLVGIVTEHDFLEAAGNLLEEALRGE